jgi:DNA-binding NarL/FixJ family response regulator
MTTLSKDEKERLFCKRYNLTNRESEILHYLLVDKTNQEISTDLFITVGTVKAHVHKIFEKTEVDRRSQLICKFEMEKLGIS